MASETNFSRINVFSSEASYTSNKGSIDNTEISLVPCSITPNIDYASTVSVGTLSTYTAPSAGQIRGYISGGGKTELTITVNGKSAVTYRTADYGYGSTRENFGLLVSAGDYVVKAGGATASEVIFTPFK